MVVLVLAATAACGDDGPGPSDDAADELFELAPLRTVVIGDSLISGGGGGDYEPDGGLCFRSRQSWPRQLSAVLERAGEGRGIEIVEDRSCGGAKTDMLLGPWPDRRQPAQVPGGRRPVLGVGVDTAPTTTTVTTAGAAVDAEDVDLVLVSIGANDVGLLELVLACAAADCAAPLTAPGVVERLERLQTRLEDEVHPALRAAYPDARIVHVGYPRLVVPAGTSPVGCRWLQAAEQVTIDAATAAVNERLEAAAGGPVTYLDIPEALEGHELCTADPWLHPLGTAEQAHPTAEGYGAIAAHVAERLPPLLDG